jgi:hypothetical protein
VPTSHGPCRRHGWRADPQRVDGHQQASHGPGSGRLCYNTTERHGFRRITTETGPGDTGGDDHCRVSRLKRHFEGQLQAPSLTGATVWAVLVPELLAYASIAGVPPVVGLHASRAVAPAVRPARGTSGVTPRTSVGRAGLTQARSAGQFPAREALCAPPGGRTFESGGALPRTPVAMTLRRSGSEVRAMTRPRRHGPPVSDASGRRECQPTPRPPRRRRRSAGGQECGWAR